MAVNPKKVAHKTSPIIKIFFLPLISAIKPDKKAVIISIKSKIIVTIVTL